MPVPSDGTILDSKRYLWTENKAEKDTSAEGLIADIKPAIRSLLAANPGREPLAIGAAVNLLSPAMLIIGNGVSLDFDLFKPSLEKSLAAHMYQNANPGLILRASPLGYNEALLGAAVLGFTA
ncbi:MAG: ROK family protein [Treponema sp.]|jgi:predicted NBD/HSP70 family sugar kinase|nr:ROK family protein [Treponema sp.]